MDCLHGWAPRGGQDFYPWGHTRRFRWPAVGGDHEVGHRVSRRGNGNGRRYNASADIDAEKRKPPFEWWGGPRTNSWPRPHIWSRSVVVRPRAPEASG